MSGAPRAVQARLCSSRFSGGDAADQRRPAAGARALLAGARSMRLCWSVALLLAAAGAAGKAGSRRPRGVEVSHPNSGSPLVIFLGGKAKITPFLGDVGEWH